MQKFINVLPLVIVSFFMMALLFNVPSTPDQAHWEETMTTFVQNQMETVEGETSVAAAQMLSNIAPAAGEEVDPAAKMQCPVCSCDQ